MARLHSGFEPQFTIFEIASRNMKRLHKGTFEFGWSHSGHSSWGDQWHKKAMAVALEEIRNRIDLLVNIKELEVFTKTDSKNSFLGDLSRSVGKDKVSSQTKISLTDDKTKEQKTRLLKEHYLLVHPSNVRIKSGTDWSHTEKNDLTGKRKWEASAVILYDLEIYGNDD